MNPDVFEDMLIRSDYDKNETNFVISGFRNGFDIGYMGPKIKRSSSKNLTLNVGNKTILWNKIMKEVGAKQVAGPFDKIPFENYIQSPIGLVPKAGEGQTRLIFHLSYDFGSDGLSVNAHTPKEWCTVKYSDIDQAVRAILMIRERSPGKGDGEAEIVYLSKSDIKSAFRVLALSRASWPWVIMKAVNPITGKLQFFVDKCLPFGASISCSHFQRVSNALKHIVQFKTGAPITKYLDDFLFIALTILRCNALVQKFISVCEKIGIPVAFDKTEWASETLIFLGILLDGRNFVLSIPLEKRKKAETVLQLMLSRSKAMVKELQALCGFLNFLGRAIFPGRVFTRRMYAKFGNIVTNKGKLMTQYKLKPHHHVRLDAEFKRDCKVWLDFLTSDLKLVVNRPMIDLSVVVQAIDIGFFSDASAAARLGFSSLLKNRWIFGAWGPEFITQEKPSIEFLELFALVAGILTWERELSNCRIIVHCDNQAVVSMVNNITSSCPNCMYLLRVLVLNGLKFNRRIFARYISTKNNYLSDALSRLDFKRFRRLGPQMNEFPDQISPKIWPVEKAWNAYHNNNMSL